MRNFLLAFQFLTILPIKNSLFSKSFLEKELKIKDEDFGKSLLFFPAAGFFIGLVLAVFLVIFKFLPSLPLSILILICLTVITGAIHLDGFADTCDGFFSGKSREKIMEIMRDSHLGAMGAVGLILLMALKISFIASISYEFLIRVLIMMSLFSKWCLVFTCYISRYARLHGKAENFIKFAGKKEILGASIFTLTFFLLLMKSSGLILFLFSLLPVVLVIFFAKNKIGGVTGDVLGAINEIAEVSLLFFALVFERLLWMC